jgi:hypothetical protein
MSDEHLYARAATRYATDFILRWVEIAKEVHGSDLLHALVFTALWAGNSSHIRGEVYQGLDDVPPDHERRPLTVRQVADSLGLPYETIRRRFVEMLEEGLIRRVGRQGFIVSEAALSKPEAMLAVRRSHASLTRFLKDLKSIGIEAA